MLIKWHGCQSVPRDIHDVRHQGAMLGILKYLRQSNDNADLVSEDFKFVDNLSVLEIVDLITVSITSYNLKLHVLSAIADLNQYIPSDNLKSQTWLEEIYWTVKQ